MAKTIQFLFHYNLYGVDYKPGDVATTDNAKAEALIASHLAFDPDAPPPPPTYADPLPQYLLRTEVPALKPVTFPTGSEPSLAGIPDGTLWVEYAP